MTTERIKRRIERLLDQVEEAADAEDWETVQRLSLQVLDMDEDNVDAQTFAKMAERSLGAAPLHDLRRQGLFSIRREWKRDVFPRMICSIPNREC